MLACELPGREVGQLQYGFYRVWLDLIVITPRRSGVARLAREQTIACHRLRVEAWRFAAIMIPRCSRSRCSSIVRLAFRLAIDPQWLCGASA